VSLKEAQKTPPFGSQFDWSIVRMPEITVPDLHCALAPSTLHAAEIYQKFIALFVQPSRVCGV